MIHIEESDAALAESGIEHRLAYLYDVSVAWLRGEDEHRDYAALDAIPGAEHLTDHDRDVIAETLASRPRKEAL